MKRPIPIYFVALWCLFVMVGQVGDVVTWCEPWLPDPINPQIARSAKGLVGSLVIWHAVWLIRLKKFNIWLSIVFFAASPVILYVNSFIILARIPKTAGLLMRLMIIAVLNVVCFVYLVRPSFRTFAGRFVAEREAAKKSEMMQKASEKAAPKDL